MKSIKVTYEFFTTNNEEDLQEVAYKTFEHLSKYFDSIKLEIVEIFPEAIHPSVKIKSKFSFKVMNYGGTHVLIIEDDNSGEMSVTNDIENVLEYIKQILLYIPAHVIYKDTDNLWDQIIHKKGKLINFYPIRAISILKACEEMKHAGV